MNYYLDTEFLEGTQSKRVPFLNFKYGKTKNTIDLISIGIVSEDDREYYAISKDFNLKEAWNRYDLKVDKHYPMGSEYLKEYWIRENVLLPIIHDLAKKDYKEKGAYMHNFGNYNNWLGYIKRGKNWEKVWYNRSKELINKYGKTNKEIAADVKYITDISNSPVKLEKIPIEFYTYYGAYDWVVFCWLFGKMIDLPKGFPMYCRDLQQIKDEVFENRLLKGKKDFKDFELPPINTWNNYPTQENEHNALDDAKWNKKLHEFLKQL